MKKKKREARSVPIIPLMFLKLPPEVRKLIYELILYVHDPPYLLRYSGAFHPFRKTVVTEGVERPNATIAAVPFEESDPGTKCLNILLTCREVFMEAYQIFYRINIFYFTGLAVMTRFLQNIGVARRQELVEIHFLWAKFNPSTLRGLKLLKTCRNLKVVGIDSYCPTPETVALREVRGFHNVYFYSGFYPEVAGLHAQEKADLRQAMMRPRLKQFATLPPEGYKFLNERRGQVRKTPAERLIEENRKKLDLSCHRRSRIGWVDK